MSSPFDSYSKEEIGNLKEKYYELEKLCLNTRDSKIIDKIIKEHKNCITSDLCINCELVEDYKYSNPGMKYPWMLLAQNENLTIKQITTIYNKSFEWQGMTFDFIFKLLDCNKLDKSKRNLILSHLVELGFEEWELAEEIFEEILNHPDFTKRELETFLSDFENNWGDMSVCEDLKQMFDDKFGAEK
jgi:hypothetical protein